MQCAVLVIPRRVTVGRSRLMVVVEEVEKLDKAILIQGSGDR